MDIGLSTDPVPVATLIANTSIAFGFSLLKLLFSIQVFY